MRNFSRSLERLYSPVPLEDFPGVLMDAAGSIISSLHVSFDELNLTTGEVRNQLSCDIGLPREEFMARWSRFAPEHPGIALAAEGKLQGTFDLGDLISRRQLRDTGIYKNIFEPCGIMAQIGADLPVEGHVVGFVYDRDRAFTCRDRQLLDLFYPHVRRAYANAGVLSSVRRQTLAPPPDYLACRRAGLTRRECETLCWLAEGKRDGEISVILGVSCRTINHHVASILRKLGVETRTTAAARAWELLRRGPDPDACGARANR